MTRVILVDDHHLVRQAVGRAMDDEPDLEVVGQGASVAQGLALVARGDADVFVVDVSLSDGSGLEVARAARAASDETGIVVLTMHADDDTLLTALDAGASAPPPAWPPLCAGAAAPTGRSSRHASARSWCCSRTACPSLRWPRSCT